MDNSKNVESYIEKHIKFKEILMALRKILNSSELEETMKWGIPTYTYENKNLVGIGAFKNHVGLWFFQGALLEDKAGKLINAQEGKTKAMRQIHFKTRNEIDAALLGHYITETIENQKKGLVIKPKRNNEEIVVPDGLQELFNKNKKLEKYFGNLTPGRKREYIEFINSAKRELTKIQRMEKITPLILSGKGLYDKYKN